MSQATINTEFLKAGLSAVVAIITLSLGWFIGQRLTHYWSVRQKNRELELSMANDFYKLYGIFFRLEVMELLFDNRRRNFFSKGNSMGVIEESNCGGSRYGSCFR